MSTWRLTAFGAVVLIVAVAGFLGARALGLFDEAPVEGTDSREPTDVKGALSLSDPADAPPTFEPGELHRLVESKLPQGSEAAVKAYLSWTAANYQRIVDLKDYTMTLIKEELIEGKRWPTEKMLVKVRHVPFSVYVKHEEPKGLKGQEAIFVEGKNDGRIIGHTTGLASLVGTLRLDPRGARAMQGNRHPITEIGFMHMIGEVVRNVPGDVKAGDTDFKFTLDAEKFGRACTVFEARRRQKRGDDPFCYDIMWIDDKSHLPIYYELYEWGKEADSPAVLSEQYSHLDVKTNVGLTDADFDPKNPEYHY